MSAGIVIVGAGLAGVSAAEALRAAGHDGAVTLFDDEGEWPYDRPPLSKAYLGNGLADEACHLRPMAWYEQQRITLRQGIGVAAFDPASRQVRTTDGDAHPYDRLLLATGARARTLPGLAAAHPRLLQLRSIADARALRSSLRPGARAILIGGGVIGMECAATAVQAGCAVTVLEAGERIMARFFPPPMSAFLASRHRAAGVAIRTGFAVERVALGEAGVTVFGSDGAAVHGDFVVAGIGAAPNVSLAAAAGLRLAAGAIAVDAAGRTSAPDVYATGDCAAIPCLQGGHARFENWTHASAHAQHVARAMLGAADQYAMVSWVWSDQYDLNIQVTGNPAAERTVLRGNMAAGRFTLFHLMDGRVVGGTTINNGRDRRPLSALVRAGAVVPTTVLADPSVPLKTLLLAEAG